MRPEGPRLQESFPKLKDKPGGVGRRNNAGNMPVNAGNYHEYTSIKLVFASI